MKRKINVIDLDRTLITVDSFRYLILRNINIKLIILCFLRIFRILSADEFASKATRALKAVLKDSVRMEKIVNFLKSKVNNEVLELIRSKTDEKTLNIIISSSPEVYVKKFAQELGFEGIGSKFENEKFFRCYGSNKLQALGNLYPEGIFEYNLAISDSESDLSLLKRFKEGILLLNEGKIVVS